MLGEQHDLTLPVLLTLIDVGFAICLFRVGGLIGEWTLCYLMDLLWSFSKAQNSTSALSSVSIEKDLILVSLEAYSILMDFDPLSIQKLVWNGLVPIRLHGCDMPTVYVLL